MNIQNVLANFKRKGYAAAYFEALEEAAQY